MGDSTTDRVKLIASVAATNVRKGTRTMVALIGWHIWLARNACVFRGKQANGRHIIEACRRNMEQWRMAGGKCIDHPFREIVT